MGKTATSHFSGAVQELARPFGRRFFSSKTLTFMSALGCRLNRSTQHFILKGKMECIAMSQRYGRGFTAAERTELWDRWQHRESLKAIGRAFGSDRHRHKRPRTWPVWHRQEYVNGLGCRCPGTAPRYWISSIPSDPLNFRQKKGRRIRAGLPHRGLLKSLVNHRAGSVPSAHAVPAPLWRGSRSAAPPIGRG